MNNHKNDFKSLPNINKEFAKEMLINKCSITCNSFFFRCLMAIF